MERLNFNPFSFRPPCFEPTRGAKPTSAWWKCRMLSMLLVLIALGLTVSTLGGCASSMQIESGKPLPLSAEMSALQSPDAKDFSEKASSYLEKVRAYFAETPTFTTQ